jgi:NADH-quinone oxidoreductase subunit M
VEAPTSGSIILASLLLKLGGFGLLRYVLPIFPGISLFFSPLVFVLACCSLIYASFITLRQVDIKRIIAYSSVAHMNLVVLGIFTFNIEGLKGAILLMIAHGITSGALFFLVGVLYERYHTRLISNFGGIKQIMPGFATTFLFFNLANLGFPGTSNFSGECLILISLFSCNSIIGFFSCLGMVFSACYSLLLFGRITQGSLKSNINFTFFDLTRQEFFVLFFCVYFTIFFGIFPQPILVFLEWVLYNILIFY